MSTKSEIDYLDLGRFTFMTEQEVLQFEVTMADTYLMQIVNSLQDIVHYFAGFLFTYKPSFDNSFQ